MMKVNAYVSHTIRGEKGKDATKQDMENNCQRAEALCSQIRSEIADVILYVPAEHEQFVQSAFDRGFMSEQQILTVDCDILERQDLLIVLTENGWEGGGIGIEAMHARENGIPIVFVDVRTEMEMTWRNLQLVIVLILEKKQASGAADGPVSMVGGADV